MLYEHITFDDICKVVCATEVSGELLKLSAKVDAHILKCQECRDTYNKMVAASNAIEEIVRSDAPKQARIKVTVLNALQKLREESNVAFSNMEEALRGLHMELNLKIEAFTEIAVEKTGLGRGFYYPAFATVAKSYNEDGFSENSGLIKSTMIDENENKISIGPDGTLTLYFNRSVCDEDILVLLIPTDETREAGIAYTKAYDKERVAVRFYEMELGEYIVAFKE